MIAGLLVLQALALGLVGEAPCTDLAPWGWSVEDLPVAVHSQHPCLDVIVAPDGLLVVAAAGTMGGPQVAVEDGGGWTVEHPINAAGCPRLDLDQGFVRLAVPTDEGVLLARREGQVWKSTLVPVTGGLWTLLPDGQVRTVDAGPFGETLVVHDSDATQDEVVPLPGTPIGGNRLDLRSLTVSAGGATHVLFQRNGHRTLEYATNADSAWSFDVVEALKIDPPEAFTGAGGGLVPLPLVVDVQERAHVAYRLRPSMKLAYATNRSGAWQRTILDHGAPIALDVNLRLAPDDTPWLAYQYVATGDLAVATRVDGAWKTVLVDALDTAGSKRALASGPDGREHVVYTRFGWGAFPYYDLYAIQHAVSLPCAVRRRP